MSAFWISCRLYIHMNMGGNNIHCNRQDCLNFDQQSIVRLNEERSRLRRVVIELGSPVYPFSVARPLEDTRRQASCGHRLGDLLRQRVYALALGYEGLNDHGELRHDLALQMAAGRLEALASPSTLYRMEQRAGREMTVAMHEELLEQSVVAHAKSPRRLILDFDSTDTPLYGEQEGRFFHAYYDGYCYLPLYVFCGRRLLVSYLRPNEVDAALVRSPWRRLYREDHAEPPPAATGGDVAGMRQAGLSSHG